VGMLVKSVTGKDEFYFDDNEFVRGDKTIFVVVPEKSTTRDLFDKLVELDIIGV
jgi:DNA-binding cell septation regulator SpoVG